MYIVSKGEERGSLELKYCECCGALWLRKAGGSEVTCGACVSLWADLPGAWVERLKRKPVESCRKNLGGVRACMAGGLA